jgi:hypothetical protein
VCYLHEDTTSLLCFIEHTNDDTTIMDLKNMDIDDDNQMLESKITELEVTPCKFVHNIDLYLR